MNSILRVLSTVWTPVDLAVAGSILVVVAYLGQRMSWAAQAKLAAGFIAAVGILQWGILAYVGTSTTDTARLLLAPGAMTFDVGSDNGVWNLTETHPATHTILGYHVSYPREAGGHLTVWEALALNTAVAQSKLAGLPSVGLTRATAAPPSDPRVLRAAQRLESDSTGGVTFALMILAATIIGVVLAMLIHLIRAAPSHPRQTGLAPASDPHIMQTATIDVARGLAVGFLIVGLYYLSSTGNEGRPLITARLLSHGAAPREENPTTVLIPSASPILPAMTCPKDQWDGWLTGIAADRDTAQAFEALAGSRAIQGPPRPESKATSAAK